MGRRFDRSQIQWDDDDSTFDQEVGRQVDDDGAKDEFASLLGSTQALPRSTWIEVGDEVEGQIMTVAQRRDGDVIIDLGGQNVGILPLAEVMNEEGVVRVKVGERLKATVISRTGGECLLSLNPSVNLRQGEALEDAFHAKLPVRGKVTGENKGGFEVLVAGKKAFCPVSQMDARFVADKQYYIGKEFDFLIEKFSGRDLVVSRRAFLAQARHKILEDIETRFAEDKDHIYQGVVAELKDFGAIVSFDGVDGMVHVSELAHSRVQRPSDVVNIGDGVRIKILKIERTTQGEPRISLSMKATSQNPWDTLQNEFEVGPSYKGRVTRIENFGAFVELKPGIEGVIHISEMSWVKRIHHPSDVVKVGDLAEVRILSIDLERRRLSLTMKSVQDDPWHDLESQLPVGKVMPATIVKLKGFGAIAELREGVTGLIPKGTLEKAYGATYKKNASPGQTLEVVVRDIDRAEKRIRLSLPQVEEGDESRKDYEEFLKEQSLQKAAKPVVNSDVGSFGELLQAKLSKK